MALDLSAAFDMVDHQILLNRLSSSFGIRGLALSWLQSYLSDRLQQIRIATSSSIPERCCFGVPQGSVLGPILFTLYTAPVGQLITSCEVMHQQYADDTQIYIALSAPDHHSSILKLEQCLSQLHHWFSANGLALNADKSEAILFGTRQRLRSFPAINSIDVAGALVPVSDSIVTLGVTLDNYLTMDKHVSTICKASYFHLRAFRHIRSALPPETATTVAVALVQSRMDYANSVLYGTSNKNLHRLQNIQNALARTVTVNYTRSSGELLSDLHWLPIRKRIDFKIATLAYNAVKLNQPSYLATLLTNANQTRSLRSTDQQLLHVPFSSTTFGSRAFSVSAAKTWNSIPLEIRNSPTQASFKKLLKTHYFTHH